MSREDGVKKYSYLIGQKINKWNIKDIYRDNGIIRADCVCECGNEKSVALKTIRNGTSKDCGCGRKKMLRETRTKNIVG